MSVSQMKKLTVLAYREDTDAVLRALMRIRCVDLRQVRGREKEQLALSSPDAASESKGKIPLSDIRSALSALAKYSARKGTFGRRVHSVDRERFSADGSADRARDTVKEVLFLQEDTETLLADLTRQKQLIATLLPWSEYDALLNDVRSSQTETVFLVSEKGELSVREKELLEQSGAYAETVSVEDKNSYFTLTYRFAEEEAVLRTVTQLGLLKIPLPQLPLTVREAVEQAEERLQQIDTELLKNEERLRELAQELDAIEILYDLEATALELQKQKRKILETRRCAVIQGWIPAEKEDLLAKTLSAFSCACEVEEPEAGEEPPVLLKNNAFASNFEWVIGMYSYPKYGTFDPTAIMGIFYFLLFGMMFADVGYGLLLTLGCLIGIRWLKPKEGMRRMLAMFAYCGISSMLMGVLFGGWFGDLPTAIMDHFIYGETGVAAQTPVGHFFANGLLFNPISEPVAFLVAGLAMGEAHLIAGMAIRMVQLCKNGKPLQGICSTVPYWILFLGLDLMAPTGVAGMMNVQLSAQTAALFSSLMTVGGYLAVAGGIGILLLNGVGAKNGWAWLTGGLGGLYSLISYASDLLSYSRILALGLAAGVISQVINMMTGLGATGPIGFFFMLVVMLLGHGLNLAINLLGTFVHTARLQYIEFFGKFYEDGGQPFSPMLPVEEYSQECTPSDALRGPIGNKKQK